MRKITASTADGPMDIFVAAPDGSGRAPALIVCQEAFGVNDHIRDVCRRLATEGYVTLAPEVYHRVGAGVTYGYGDGAIARESLATLTTDGLAADIDATLAAARDLPEVNVARVGIVGFCMGGFMAFLAACRSDVKTAVSFYGGGLVHPRANLKLTPPIGEVERIHAPLLMFFGEADAGIPSSDVATLREELKSRDKVHEIVVYPGAGHGFFCEARPSYNAEAAADAWLMTLAWLRERL